MVRAAAFALFVALAVPLATPTPAAAPRPAAAAPRLTMAQLLTERKTLALAHAAVKSGAAPRDAISDIFDTIRDIIRENYDPYEVDSLVDLDLQENRTYEVTAGLHDVVVTGLGSFEEDTLFQYIPLLNMRATVSLTLPQLLARGGYNFDSLLGEVVHLYGDGDFRLDVSDFNIKVVVMLRSRVTSTQVTSVDVELLIGDVQLAVEGLLDGGIVDPLFNTVVNLVAKEIYKSQKSVLEDFIAEALFDPIQEVVGEIGWNDLLCLVLGMNC